LGRTPRRNAWIGDSEKERKKAGERNKNRQLKKRTSVRWDSPKPSEKTITGATKRYQICLDVGGNFTSGWRRRRGTLGAGLAERFLLSGLQGLPDQDTRGARRGSYSGIASLLQG